MKYAILSPFYPYRGGIAQFSAMLYKTLEKDGHEVKAFNFSRLYPDTLFPGKTQYVEKGDNAIVIESERVLDSVNPLSYFKAVEAIKRFNPDVLIISYWMSFFVPGYAHIANRMKKHCKVVALIHNAIPHEPRFFDKPMAKLLFSQCHSFIVLSEAVADDLKSLCPKAKYILNPHPLYNHFGDKISKDEACEKLNISKEKKTLLFFGLIRDYKGLDLLIEAMHNLGDDFQLVIAGECYGSFDKYQKMIDNSPAKERIHVYNQYIADDDIPQFFSAADALILPYRSATQSGVVSIAYHYNIPMISTPVGDFGQSIGKPQTGIVVTDINSDSIRKGIEELFSNDKYNLCLENIGKEKASLSWEKLTEKIEVMVR